MLNERPMVFVNGHPFMFVPDMEACDVHEFLKKQRVAFAMSEGPGKTVKFEFPSMSEADAGQLVTQLMRTAEGAWSGNAAGARAVY
jgi:hypothetical protein